MILPLELTEEDVMLLIHSVYRFKLSLAEGIKEAEAEGQETIYSRFCREQLPLAIEMLARLHYAHPDCIAPRR